MTEQLTPWYDPKVDGQPVRVGCYQRKYDFVGDRSCYRDYWDGEKWYLSPTRILVCKNQDRPWRGLTEPNEEKQ